MCEEENKKIARETFWALDQLMSDQDCGLRVEVHNKVTKDVQTVFKSIEETL